MAYKKSGLNFIHEPSANVAMDAIINDLARSFGISPLLLCGLLGLLCGFYFGRKTVSRDQPSSGPSSFVQTGVSSSGTVTAGRPLASMFAGSHSEMKFNINGREVSIAGESARELGELILRGNKIEAIKFLRERAQLDLKDAKEIVDTFAKISLGT